MIKRLLRQPAAPLLALVTLAIAGGVVILAAIAGSAVPAWSAARPDPMVALRDE